MKKYLWIGIAVLVVIVLIVVLYFSGVFKKGASGPTNGSESSTEPVENPDIAKFQEYFKSLYLGKIPVGQKLDSKSAAPEASLVFTEEDQFCTVLEAAKTIPSGIYASAIYDVNSKTFIIQKMLFNDSFQPGTSAGCGQLALPAGKYEYKAYIDDILVVALPFEIK